MAGDAQTPVLAPAQSPRNRWPSIYMPRTNAVQRIQRHAQLAVVCLLAAIIAMVSVAQRFGSSTFTPLYGLIGMGVALFGSLTLPSVFVRRGKAKLNACGWRCCEWCGYDTKAIGESGQCPECGQQFSSDFLRKDFDNFARLSVITIAFQPVFVSKGNASAVVVEAQSKAAVTGPRDYVERSMRRGFRLQFVVMAAAWLLLGLLDHSLLQGVSWSRLSDCVWLGLLVRLGYSLFQRSRLSCRNWKVCRWCMFDTRDVGMKGTCPRCGEAFSAIDLRADFDGATFTTAVIYGFLSDVSIPVVATGVERRRHSERGPKKRP